MSVGMIWYKTQPDSAIASFTDKALSDLLGRITSHDITVHPQKIAPMIKSVFSRSNNVIIVCGPEAVRTENNIISILSHALGIPMETRSRSRSKFCCDTIRGIRLQSLAGSVLFPSRFGGFEGILLMSGVQNIIVLPAAAKSVQSMVVSMHKFLLPQIRAQQTMKVQAEKNTSDTKLNPGSVPQSTTRSYDEYELQCKMENAISEMRRREGRIADSMSDDYNRSDYEDYRPTSEDAAYYKKRTLGRKIRNAVSLAIVAAVACSVIAVGSHFDMSTFASSMTSEAYSLQTEAQNDTERSLSQSEATSAVTKSKTTAKAASAASAAVSKTTNRETSSVTSAETTAKKTSSTTKKATAQKTTSKTTAKRTSSTTKKNTVKKTTIKKTTAKQTTVKKTSATTKKTTAKTTSAATSSSVTDNAAATQTTAVSNTTIKQTETTKKTTTTAKNTSSNLTMRIKSNGKVVSGNAVDILASIVEAEMGSTYNLEALKAQAVAAYTFYLYNGGSSKTPSFPTKTPGARAKSAAKAVLGKKMTYNGKIPYTPYYAISAGKTAANATINGTSLPYLKAVDCSPDKSASGYKTVKSYSSSQVAKKVKANTGITLTSISKNNWFKITERDANGLYVVKVNVGGKSYRGSKLWLSILGSSYLRSACFYISYNGQSDTFTFTSYGYGHGVGMSQKGANAYAAQGKNYQWILKHFYSGVTIT